MVGKCDKMNRIAGVMVLTAATLGAMAIAMTAQTYSTNENPAEDRLPQAAPLPGIGWICILTATRMPCGGACGKRS